MQLLGSSCLNGFAQSVAALKAGKHTIFAPVDPLVIKHVVKPVNDDESFLRPWDGCSALANRFFAFAFSHRIARFAALTGFSQAGHILIKWKTEMENCDIRL